MAAAVEQPLAIPSNGVNAALAGINDAVAGLTKKFQDLTKVDSAQNVLETVELPPGQSGRPYIVSTQDGEIIYIPLSKSATRLLVTGKETDNAFAVVASGGSQSDPIGFHYHREAHDVFLCLQGEVNVWANDKGRTMSSGDFASVPPGAIHQYQILGAHSEFTGLIVPGGWEEFFRHLGEPYNGPMWPMEDKRNFFEVLLPKLKAAAEKFDMVPCPQHKGAEPQAWEASDNQLPGKSEPYFLKNNSGPAYIVGGTVCRPLITTAESAGKFAIGSIEGSSHSDLNSGIFSKSGCTLRFQDAHHAFQVVQGAVEFSIGLSTPSRLTAGELLYVPKDSEFRFRAVSRFAKMYAFSNGGGLVELLQKLGQSHPHSILPEKASTWEESKLESLGAELGFSVRKTGIK